VKRAIQKSFKDFSAIIVMIVIAAGVGGYIMKNQRLRFPVIDSKPMKLKAEFSTAQAVTPGQGQTVRVSGVKVGDISKVNLVDGRAIVTMDIDQKYKDIIHTDATALLRPKTGLKDMFIDITPGTASEPLAKEGWTMPINNTLPDINPDEVYAGLDDDTRAYLKLLVNGAGRGLDKRGKDLQEVFARFEPTNRDIAKVTKYVALRRHNLKRLIHSLAQLNTELARRGDDLSQLVSASATVFNAFAQEDKQITRATRLLPGALHETTGALSNVNDFAKILRPAADDLRPAVRALDRANASLTPFEKATTPILRDSIRPFVRDARPIVRDLKAPARDLANATPDLTGSFKVLNDLFNFISYNPDGAETPNIHSRQEGYLFWIAWLSHQAVNLFSSGDANGTWRPLFLGGNCSALKNLATNDPTGTFVALLNLAPILSNPTLCG
jgi:phospholipid/cholesterol/gamma-HCH transport system substrate-binding protein